eukprot:g2022.t1
MVLRQGQSVKIDGNGIELDGGNKIQLFHLDGGHLHVRGPLLMSNGHGQNGGAIFVDKDGQLIADRVTFRGNSNPAPSSQLDAGGGAVSIRGTTEQLLAVANLTDCLFESNTAKNGGAMLVWIGSATISNCTFRANHGAKGAALFAATKADDSERTPNVMNVVQSTFEQNDNSGDSMTGGGIYLDGRFIGITKITRCIFDSTDTAPAKTGATIYGNALFVMGGARFAFTLATLPSEGGGFKPRTMPSVYVSRHGEYHGWNVGVFLCPKGTTGTPIDGSSRNARSADQLISVPTLKKSGCFECCGVNGKCVGTCGTKNFTQCTVMCADRCESQVPWGAYELSANMFIAAVYFVMAFAVAL